MATYATIPKDEAEPLVAAAPKASPKFKAAALAICLTSAVAGYAAPSAIKYLAFSTQGNGNMPAPIYSRDVQLCLEDDDDYCLGVPNKGDSGIDNDNSDLTVYSESTPKQGIQLFTYEEYIPCSGCQAISRLRFKSKGGSYNGCVALYGRNGQYSNGGSKIQMQTCELEANQGGQRQNIQIPGSGRQNNAEGTLKFYLTNNLCIGSTKGSVGDNKDVYSDQCRTGYKVKLVGDAPPGPPPDCGRKCSSDSDCQTGGFVQYPTCYVNSGTMCHGYCGP